MILNLLLEEGIGYIGTKNPVIHGETMLQAVLIFE